MPSPLERLRLALGRAAGPPRLAGDHAFASLADFPGRAPVPAAVLVPVLARPEPTVLLTRRTAHLKHHAGQVAFPGGRIDPGDPGPVAAALREAQEEVGLPPDRVDVLGLSDPYVTATGYRVHPVVGVVDPGVALRPNVQEVAELFEVPLAHVLDPSTHQLREAEWQGRIRRFYVIEWQGRTIWGATAGMLVNLAARLP